MRRCSLTPSFLICADILNERAEVSPGQTGFRDQVMLVPCRPAERRDCLAMLRLEQGLHASMVCLLSLYRNISEIFRIISITRDTRFVMYLASRGLSGSLNWLHPSLGTRNSSPFA